MRLPNVSIDPKNWSLGSTKQAALKLVYALARSSLPEILFISTYIISHYLPNADFSYPYELLMPIILMGVLISIFYYSFKFIFKRALTAHVAALPLAYGLYHYGDFSRQTGSIINPILPNSLETPFVLAILSLLGAAVLYGIAAYYAVRLLNRWQQIQLGPQLLKIALFIITFNFSVQAVVLANFFFHTHDQLKYTRPYTAPQRSSSSTADIRKPDIYYLVFDRYANAETLKKTYNYDNSAFLQFLNDEGFVTRENAYANYPYTMSSVGSTLAMDYLPDISKFAGDAKQSGFPYRSILNDPPAIHTLQENGYKYNLINSWWDFLRIGPTADSTPTQSFRLRLAGYNFNQSDFSRDIINRTALSPLLKKGIRLGDTTILRYELDRDPRENFESQMTALKTLAKSQHKQPQFTFGHILLPHDPYIFGPDGSPTTYSRDRNDRGADEYVKYTNQVTYVNGRIKELIKTIKSASPDAIIIMQSDEGPYPKEFRGSLTKDHYFDPKNLKTESMQQKMGIQASYYFPNDDPAKVAANMTSNVNTFRFVLSNYLGYNLPLLPNCHFSMGNKFDLFTFELLNKQLTGEDASRECSRYLKAPN